jgi:hypothetical protein
MIDQLRLVKITLHPNTNSTSNQIVGIFATQKNHLVESNELKAGSVIKLAEFASNVVSKDHPKYVL